MYANILIPCRQLTNTFLVNIFKNDEIHFEIFFIMYSVIKIVNMILNFMINVLLFFNN